MLFWSKRSPLLGVDLSASVIKLVELSQNPDGKYTVESYGVQVVPQGGMVDGRIEDTEKVAEVLKDALERSGSKTKNAAIAIPANAVITKVLSVPAELEGVELEEHVMIQATNYIPHPIEEVRVDFQEISDSSSMIEENATESDDVEESSSKKVLLVAARSEYVDKRAEVLTLAGLKPKVVDVESYCVEVANALVIEQTLKLGVESKTAVVDIGANRTTLNVLEQGKMLFSREQLFGGRLLTEQIEHYYGLSYQEAGKLKKQGGLPDDYDEIILDPFKRSMAQTVNRLLEFFYAATTHNDSVDNIVLAGGCAAIEGVDKVVEEITGVPTFIANPFAEMTIAPRVDKEALMNDSSAMMVACGLALRGVGA